MGFALPSDQCKAVFFIGIAQVDMWGRLGSWGRQGLLVLGLDVTSALLRAIAEHISIPAAEKERKNCNSETFLFPFRKGEF